MKIKLIFHLLAVVLLVSGNFGGFVGVALKLCEKGFGRKITLKNA